VTFPPTPLDGPVLLRIAADALAGLTDYADDHIWELTPGGEPPALALTTTFGRRAASMRVFPSFGMGGPIIADPASFVAPGVVHAALPSYLDVRFAPLPGLDVRAEWRVVDSHTAAGRLTVTNRTDRFRPVRLGLHGHLVPAAGGQPMLPRTFAGATALAGRTGGLEPVLFLTGGSIEDPGLAAGLVVRVDLAPGAGRAFTWGEAALATGAASFERARSAAARPWDADVARLERVHARWVEVDTGRADWDAALHLAQQHALNAIVGPGGLADRRSLVLLRTPDHGYSPSGDGRDHAEGWDGASALETYALLSQIVWSAPEAAADVLGLFWGSQTAGGEIDARPGLAGQRARAVCPPLLGTIALKIHDVLNDQAFLDEAFRSLWPSFRSWSSPRHDRDGDGWPEWDHAGHPPWPAWWTQGGPEAPVDATVIEDPALAALVYREAGALAEMARRLGRREAVAALEARRQQLRSLVQRAWSTERHSFLRIERDSHRTSRRERIAHGRGPASARASRAPTRPARLMLRVETQQGAELPVRARLRGRVESGRVRVELLRADRFRWRWTEGAALTDLAFASIEAVEVTGLPDGAAWEVSTLDLEREDLSLLLPLWARMVDPAQARQVVEACLPRYFCAAGLAALPVDEVGADPRGGVHPGLNLLLGEALIAYGYHREVADLLGRLLDGAVEGLRAGRAWHEFYHPQTRAGLGRRHYAAGAPWLSLFLDVIGVDLRSPNRVLVTGASPFEGPVAVRWRGVQVEREGRMARVVLAGGARTAHEVTEPTAFEEPEPAI